MITWIPWNPVPIKYTDEYAEHENVNDATQYSISCRIVNVAPRINVNIKEYRLSLNSPDSVEWWHQVTEIPDDTSRTVFKKGIPFGSNTVTPRGGHILPVTMDGDSAK